VREALSESQADVEVLQSHLALIRDIAALGEAALGDDDFASRLASLLVTRLGVERSAVYLRDEFGRLSLAGSASQSERFGAPHDEPPELLGSLAREVAASTTLTRWGGKGTGTRRGAPRKLEGSATGLPIMHGGRCLGAVILTDLLAGTWNLPRHRAIETAGQIIGQVLAAQRLRHQLEAAHRELEVELSATSTRLAHRERAIAEQQSRLHALDVSLARANRVKTTFLGLMSHELRTPLAAILGFTAILREGVPGPVTEEQEQVLARIHSNARNLAQLIDDLLFLADAESGKVAPDRARVALRPLLRDLVAALPGRAGSEPRIAVSIQRDAREIDADPQLLRRALFHLMSNAVKFGAEGEIRIEVERTADGGALLRVLDSGAGLEGEDVGRLFEAFEQGGEDEGARFGGAGLGLSLARICAAIHGGRCALSRVPRGGTSAELWIPPVGPKSGTAPEPPSAGQGERSRAQRSSSGSRPAKEATAPRRASRARPRGDVATTA
jgi:signal transduction histidine kinase